MMEQERGLFALPTRKTVPADGVTILRRVLDALLADENCRWDFKGPYRRLTEEEQANWEARDLTAHLLASFPNSARSEIEPEYKEST